MTPLRTLVAAVDFSAGSDLALARAVRLAGRSGAALHVLHADVLFHSSGGDAAVGAPTPDGLRQRLAAVAREAGAADPTLAVVRDVTAVGAILRYTAEADADLLVLGTHGRTGLARLLMGSVAEACVASASCPVLTVPAPSFASASGPVLVAVDFGEQSRSAIAAGQRVAALYGAGLELVHVVQDAGPYPGLAPNILSLTEFDPERGEAVRDRLARFAETVPGAAPTALHIAMGVPSRLLAALAEAREARTLVMGTHGRTGLAHAFIGSVAEVTLRKASCPVLTLRQPHRLGRIEQTTPLAA